MVFALESAQEGQRFSFPRSTRSPPVTNPAICSLHVTPESPTLHEPNLLSQHTNPQKSYVHRASLLPPAGPTPARAHLDILLSRRFLGACVLCAFVLLCFHAFVFSCFRTLVLLCSVLPMLLCFSAFCAFCAFVCTCVRGCFLCSCAFVLSKSAFVLRRH